jgi:error-prone DNA polymerase
LRGEPLELWAAAAERKARNRSKAIEPEVVLTSMTQGREVVEDYSRTGLTLRKYPLSFMREYLNKRRIVTCFEAGSQRDGR